MKLRLVKSDYYKLSLADEESEIIFNKLKFDIIYEGDFKKCRNPKFHRKFFALINKGFENTKSGITNFEFYRAYIIMKGGYYESIETKKGIMILPKSISFEKMDDFEFEKLYNASFTQVIIDTEADEELFKKELINF